MRRRWGGRQASSPQSMSYFIHIADPTYAGFGDFPFGRRLGPFNSLVEARNQAVSDVANGTGTGYLGVYSETESEKMRGGGEGKPTVAEGELEERAAEEREKLERERAKKVAESDPARAAQWDALYEAAAGNAEILAIIQELQGRQA